MTLGLQEAARRLGRPVRVRLAVDKAQLVTTWSGFEQIPDGHTLIASLSAVNESSTLPPLRFISQGYRSRPTSIGVGGGANSRAASRQSAASAASMSLRSCSGLSVS